MSATSVSRTSEFIVNQITQLHRLKMSTTYPSMEWPKALDIPLKASEELVSIDLETDLPENPADLRTLLVEESSEREHWLTIAAAYCNQGHVDAGISLIEMALEEFPGPDQASLHTFLTWAHLRRAKESCGSFADRETALNRAEQHLKDAIGIDPTWIGNMLATVELYYEKGLYDKAWETSDLFMKGIHAENLRSGKQTKPNCIFSLIRAKILYQKRNYTASLKLFQELMVMNPMLKPDPRIGIGLCFWQLKDYNMAIKSWERVLELDPGNKPTVILLLLSKFNKTILDSENDLQFKENFTNALRDLESVYTQNKESPVLLALLQTYYYFRGEYQTVIDIYEKKIQKNEYLASNNVISESLFFCGRAHYALGDYLQAFKVFQESLKRNEDNFLAKLGLGQTQIKNQLIEESILTFENIYKANDSIQEVNYILGLLYAEKCFSASDGKQVLNKEAKVYQEKAFRYLDRYVKLTIAKKNQLVLPRAYLVLSQLYEVQNRFKHALEQLNKAIECMNVSGSDDIPIGVMNNLGCFSFVLGHHKEAQDYFTQAREKLAKLNSSQLEPFSVTLNFNYARSIESDNLESAKKIYHSLVETYPDYIFAKIRHIFTKFILNNKDHASIAVDMEELAKSAAFDDLDVRAFYGWYLKEVGGKDSEAKETQHSKETLTKYDSHDSFALLSLANLYYVLGKEAKRSSNHKEQDKAKEHFLKGIQLYQKVLQVDPFNVFAAQGVAIMFAENKRLGVGLEIFRKVKDTLDNEDVHLNIANCLLEMHDYVKAIENYEYFLKKYPDYKKKAKVMVLLARAWYSRALKERSVPFFQNSMNTIDQVLDIANKEALDPKFVLNCKFNAVIVQFQIAESLRRSHPRFKTTDQVKGALKGLGKALAYLKELKSKKDFKLISKDELEQRIQLGETTMKSALERSIVEQEQYELSQSSKLEEAKKLKNEMLQEEARRKELEEEQERLKTAKKVEEFKRLQDEAQRLIQEREQEFVNEGEVEEQEGKKKKGKRRKQATKDALIYSDEEDEVVTRKRARKEKQSESTVTSEMDNDEEKSGEEGDDLF